MEVRYTFLVCLIATLVVSGTWSIKAVGQVFEIRDVKVDVTADTAAKAREEALARGESEALNRMLRRLTLSEDHAKLPKFNHKKTTEFVSDFSVSDEKTSSVRYLARLHYRFKPNAIRGLLRDSGFQFAETPSKPILVLPVFQPAGGLVLWEAPNPWRDAWSRRGTIDGLVTFALPLGDLADISTLNVNQAVRGEVAALGKLAARYRAGDTIVVYARSGLDPASSGRRIDVSMTRFSLLTDPETDFLGISQQEDETEEDTLIRAVNLIVNQLEDSWKRRNLLVGGELRVAAVTVPISGLGDWLDVKMKLENVTVVRALNMVLMSLDEVRVNLHYAGGTGQLQTALGQSDMALLREENEWVLYPSDAISAPSQ